MPDGRPLIDAGPLISVTELADALAAGPPPVLLDVRWRLGGPPGIDSYQAGHLPGAVYLDLDRELAGPPGPDGRHPLPDPADFEAAMRRAGVSGRREVVVYDESDATIAARAWWMLRFYGHQNVRVLDGGYRAWIAAGLPVSTEDPRTAARRLHRPAGPDAGAGRRRGSSPGQVRHPAGCACPGPVPGRDRAGRPGRRPHSRRDQRAHGRERDVGRCLPAGRGAAGPVR